MITFDLDDVSSNVNPYALRPRVQWSAVAAADPGEWVAITLDAEAPMLDRRDRGRRLVTAARAWARDHGYALRTGSAPEWSAVAFRFTPTDDKEQDR